MAVHRGAKGVATAAVALAILGAVGPARGQSLGEASGFTEFIFQDATRNGDTTGAVAIGGKANFQANGSFTVENSSGMANTLVVGGDLTGQFGTIGANYRSGSVYVGGTLNFSDPSIYGHVSANGVNLSNFGNIYGNLTYFGSYANPNTGINGTKTQVANPIASPIHFSTDQTILTQLSHAQYKSSDPTVGYDPGGGNHLTFAATGSGTSDFTVDAKTLANSFGLTFAGSSTGQSIVVNVTDLPGTSDILPNVGYTLSGITNDHVLFNFYQATSLSISSAVGSVLAPGANVTLNSGSLNGELIALSETGSTETHVYAGGGSSGQLTPFDGGLRPVPEPASLALLAVGGLGLLAHARRSRRAGSARRLQ